MKEAVSCTCRVHASRPQKLGGKEKSEGHRNSGEEKKATKERKEKEKENKSGEHDLPILQVDGGPPLELERGVGEDRLPVADAVLCAWRNVSFFEKWQDKEEEESGK
jgi:hypothetical protein